MRRQPSSENLETPITSLIDVVFQLIIFFVVTAAAEKDLVDTNVKLAQAKYVKAEEKREANTIIINVPNDGNVNIAMQPVTPKQLHQILSSSVSKFGNQMTVILRCDGEVLFRDVDRIIQVIGKAGLYRIRISAEALQ